MTSISIPVPPTTVALDLDTVIATVVKAGYTVTPTPVVPVPPVVTPPVVTPPVVTPPAAAGAVYTNGQFHWAGDWSGKNSTIEYGFAETPGAAPVIRFQANAPWAYWLPYPQQNSAGPSANGVNFPIKGFTRLNFSVKPTKSGGQASIGFYKGLGTQDDIANGVGAATGPAAYGPASMVANQWNVYSMALADFKLTNPDWIYKFIMQQQNVTPDTWAIKDVYFS